MPTWGPKESLDPWGPCALALGPCPKGSKDSLGPHVGMYFDKKYWIIQRIIEQNIELFSKLLVFVSKLLNYSANYWIIQRNIELFIDWHRHIELFIKIFNYSANCWIIWRYQITVIYAITVWLCNNRFYEITVCNQITVQWNNRVQWNNCVQSNNRVTVF